METFEGGYVITLQSTTGEREVRHTYYDGDPVVPFEERILRWLHQQPWPNEDDPRVQHEGAFA